MKTEIAFVVIGLLIIGAVLYMSPVVSGMLTTALLWLALVMGAVVTACGILLVRIGVKKKQ